MNVRPYPIAPDRRFGGHIPGVRLPAEWISRQFGARWHPTVEHAADLTSSVAHSGREVRGLMEESRWIGVRSPEFRTAEFLTSLEGVLACH